MFSNLIAAGVNKMKRTFGYTQDDIPKSDMPPVIDKMNVDSEVGPEDLKVKDKPQDETEDAKVELVGKRWKDSSDGRVPHNRIWFDSWYMLRGGPDQWKAWDADTAQCADFRYEDTYAAGEEDRRVWSARNKIKPLVLTVQALALQSKPILGTAPATDGQKDRMAADEGRAVLTHLNRLYDEQRHLFEATQTCLGIGPYYRKLYWDGKAQADVPQFGPDGQIEGMKRAPVGELGERGRMPFYLYLDPKAKDLDSAAYVIDAEVIPLDEVQRFYGNNFLKRGYLVKADTSLDQNGIESRMAYTTGDTLRSSDQQKNAVLVKECWEKPSARYPRGRILVVANEMLLRDDEWPDFLASKGWYPFVELRYNEAVGTPYGQNLVQELIDPQRSVNKTVSRMEEWRDEATWMILAAKGSEVGVDAYSGNRLKEVVYYNPINEAGVQTTAPALQSTPQMVPDYLQMIELEDKFMQDISGARDISQGAVPSGVSAAQAINLLQQANNTQTAAFLQALTSYLIRLGELRIMFAAAYYNEPRLVEVDDVAEQDPMAARLKVQTFKALNAGGSCRVVIQPGTGIAESPAAKAEKYERWFQMGLLGPAGTPSSIEAFFEVMGESMSDKALDLVRKAFQEAQASQPNPAQIAALQAQSQQQQTGAKLQAQQAIEDMRLRHEQQKIAMQQQHEAERMAIEHNYQQQADEAAHGRTMQSTLLKGLTPNVSYAMKGDPAATEDFERQIGLDGDAESAKPAAPAQGDKNNGNQPHSVQGSNRRRKGGR